MGLTDWMLLKGPGGPGATAKVMCISYNAARKDGPQAPAEEILVKTLQARYRQYDDLSALEIVRRTGSTLAGLTAHFWFQETPAAAMRPDVRAKAERIIAEECTRHAPGA